MALTIKDLAELTGISTSTISRALSNKGYVNEETRAAVLKAVEEHGYQYKPVTHRKNSTDMVLLILGLMDSNVYYQGVHGISSVFDALGITYMVAYGDPFDTQKLEAHMRWAIRNRCRGMILFSAVETPSFRRIVQNTTIPCVSIIRPVDSIKMDSICMDNKTAGRMATQYLIDRGHRRIINLTVTGGSASNYRTKGYLEAMQNAGLDVHENDIIEVEEKPGVGIYIGSYIAVSRKDVTAIYTSNENLAREVIEGLQRCGKRCPADISVISTDNTSLAENFTPRLTTVSCDVYRMGAEAAQLFVSRCENPIGEKKQIYLCPQIIERDSVADIR